MNYKDITAKNLSFKVGDLVTAYRKGFHRVVAITPRFVTESDFHGGMGRQGYLIGDEFAPLVEYQQVAKADGTPIKSKSVYTCDASYVGLAAENISAKLQELVRTEARLKKLLLEKE